MIIISNDINLVNKAIISNIQAINFNNFKNNFNRLIENTRDIQSQVNECGNGDDKYFEGPFIKGFFKDLVR